MQRLELERRPEAGLLLLDKKAIHLLFTEPLFGRAQEYRDENFHFQSQRSQYSRMTGEQFKYNVTGAMKAICIQVPWDGRREIRQGRRTSHKLNAGFSSRIKYETWQMKLFIYSCTQLTNTEFVYYSRTMLGRGNLHQLGCAWLLETKKSTQKSQNGLSKRRDSLICTTETFSGLASSIS